MDLEMMDSRNKGHLIESVCTVCVCTLREEEECMSERLSFWIIPVRHDQCNSRQNANVYHHHAASSSSSKKKDSLEEDEVDHNEAI